MKNMLFFALISLLFGSTAHAQDNLLSSGDAVIGTLDTGSPVGFYIFNGTAGDLVTIQVIGVGIDPAVSLNAPNQQQLISSDNDPTNAGSTDARISYVLPQTGAYTILVSSVTGAPGQYLLRLTSQAPPVGQALTDAPALVDIIAGPQAQVFTFNADPAAPTVLNISAVTPGFRFQAVVRNASGQIVALVTDSAGFTYTVPPGDSAYSVELSPADPASIGQVSVGLGAAAAIPAPVATEEVAAPPLQVDSTGACTVGAQGTAVNVRSGPGVNFGPIAQLQPGNRLAVTGVSGTWYQVEVPGVGYGWVRQDVIVTFGACNALPQVDTGQIAPPAEMEETDPAQITTTYTPTSTPTYTPTTAQGNVAPVQATSTYTFTPTPTQAQQIAGPTATNTPTTAQQSTSTLTPTTTSTPTHTATVPIPTAPPDANFNSPLNIPLDSTASTTDFLSYPGGDTEDRVRWDITGMNPNTALSGGRARLIITASCFGTGTQNIQFFTGGQTFSCGQTLVDREVTSDSRTGQVTITATGGNNTYAQWVLTGSATRVN